MLPSSHTIGKKGEQLCCDYLLSHGLALIERNYRGARGEIDIIMKDGDTLVFVEVRYRKNETFGGALESVNALKRERLRATALQYMQSLPPDSNARFDVVGMSGNINNVKNIDWIKNAF